MAPRRIRVERLIAVLGVAVLPLGVLTLWLVPRGGGLGAEPSVEERAGAQFREHVGPEAVVRYTERGRRRAVCGLVSADDQLIVFISRPNRLLLETDPLKAEFDDERSNVIVAAVSLDPHHTRSAFVELPLEELGIDPAQPYQMEDLLSGESFLWQGARNYVELDPRLCPAHVFRVRQQLRSEKDFEHFA